MKCWCFSVIKTETACFITTGTQLLDYLSADWSPPEYLNQEIFAFPYNSLSVSFIGSMIQCVCGCVRVRVCFVYLLPRKHPWKNICITTEGSSLLNWCLMKRQNNGCVPPAGATVTGLPFGAWPGAPLPGASLPGPSFPRVCCPGAQPWLRFLPQLRRWGRLLLQRNLTCAYFSTDPHPHIRKAHFVGTNSFMYFYRRRHIRKKGSLSVGRGRVGLHC